MLKSDRALLITLVNRNLNSEILKFMQPFSKLFEVLQFNSKRTINFAVFTYYEAAKRCPTENPVIATLKKEFLMVLKQRCLTRGPRAIFGPRKGFEWPAQDFSKSSVPPIW